MSVFGAANATIDQLLDRTLAEWRTHLAAGGTDDTYQQALVAQFVTAAAAHKPPAGAVHMALTLYRLARTRELAGQLADENARYAATLADLDTLEGL